jgi:hypothetical protein
MVPTPQPVFGGGASLLEESAHVHKQTAMQTSPPSLLQVGALSQDQKRNVAAAAAAAQAALQQAALQKSAVQDTIIKQTTTFVHHEDESEEARYRRHRRWLNGGGNSNPKLGLVSDKPVFDRPKEPAMVEVDYSFQQARTYEVEPRRPVAAALQTHESAATASASAYQGNPVPYNVLPPPPGPPPKMPPTRHDFRPGFNVCPAHSPCNCYCHCKAPPASMMAFQPSHDQPIFEG